MSEAIESKLRNGKPYASRKLSLEELEESLKMNEDTTQVEVEKGILSEKGDGIYLIDSSPEKDGEEGHLLFVDGAKDSVSDVSDVDVSQIQTPQLSSTRNDGNSQREGETSATSGVSAPGIPGITIFGNEGTQKACIQQLLSTQKDRSRSAGNTPTKKVQTPARQGKDSEMQAFIGEIKKALQSDFDAIRIPLLDPQKGVVSQVQELRETVYQKDSGLVTKVESLTNVVLNGKKSIATRLGIAEGLLQGKTTGLVTRVAKLENLKDQKEDAKDDMALRLSSLESDVNGEEDGISGKVTKLETSVRKIASAIATGDGSELKIK